MFPCNKLFLPYTTDGETLKSTIEWLRNEIDIDDRIEESVMNDTMVLLSQGKRFPLPCPCGCGESEVHIPIRHFMLELAFNLKNRIEKAITEVLNQNEAERLDKMVNSGKIKQITDKHVPTFKKGASFLFKKKRIK